MRDRVRRPFVLEATYAVYMRVLPQDGMSTLIFFAMNMTCFLEAA